jgi:flagellar biosynthetic protein FliP
VKADGSNAVQLLLLIGGISLVPALLFTVTGFTRILIVLGFIRSGLGTPTSPPNQVLVGIALFLTLFVMAPTFNTIKHDAIEPLQKNKISQSEALKRGEAPLRDFMFRQTRTKDLALFVSLSKMDRPKTRADIPTYVLIPSFIISEL